MYHAVAVTVLVSMAKSVQSLFSSASVSKYQMHYIVVMHVM